LHTTCKIKAKYTGGKNRSSGGNTQYQGKQKVCLKNAETDQREIVKDALFFLLGLRKYLWILTMHIPQMFQLICIKTRKIEQQSKFKKKQKNMSQA